MVERERGNTQNEKYKDPMKWRFIGMNIPVTVIKVAPNRLIQRPPPASFPCRDREAADPNNANKLKIPRMNQINLRRNTQSSQFGLACVKATRIDVPPASMAEKAPNLIIFSKVGRVWT